MSAEPSYKKLTPAQIIEANRLLGESLTKLEDGYASYISPATDATIAATMGVSVQTIATLRLKLYGKVRIAREPKSDRITQLEQKIAELEFKFARLDQDCHEKLRYQQEKHEQFRDRVSKKLWHSNGIAP